jgi:hypothetical protein
MEWVSAIVAGKPLADEEDEENNFDVDPEGDEAVAEDSAEDDDEDEEDEDEDDDFDDDEDYDEDEDEDEDDDAPGRPRS